MNFRRGTARGESTSRFACLSGELDFRFVKYLGILDANCTMMRDEFENAVATTRTIRIFYPHKYTLHSRGRRHTHTHQTQTQTRIYTHSMFIFIPRQTLSFASSFLFNALRYDSRPAHLHESILSIKTHSRRPCLTFLSSVILHYLLFHTISLPSYWRTSVFLTTEYRCNLTDLFVSGELLFYRFFVSPSFAAA